MAAASVPPLLPPPPPALPAARSTTWPVGALRSLLAAVITVSAGRLASVPPPLLTWLLHVMTPLGYRPPTNWLAELYDSLLERLDDLKQAAAAQAFMVRATHVQGLRRAISDPRGGRSQVMAPRHRAESVVSSGSKRRMHIGSTFWLTESFQAQGSGPWAFRQELGNPEKER